MSPSVAFTTLGCRLNQAESDLMHEELARVGFRAPGQDDPDVVVVNTCTVTREATKASRAAIRRAARTHPRATVVVTGCYAVSDPDEVAAIEGVDVVLGNDDKDAFVESLSRSAATAPLLQIGRLGEPVPAPLPQRVRANLKVQTGCDEWCSFCIIPTTRGPLRSVPEDDLVRAARVRVAAGAREIVLTGVHLGKYSFDLGGSERGLVRLLRRLLDIEGLLRLRLSSILCRHLTEEVVELIASEPRICRHLHVPLQSGDDSVLAAMHRPYRVEEYVAAVEGALERVPGLALATDVIVGFPDESDEAFERTVEVVSRIGFSKLHVFRYSPRPGTAAASARDGVPADVKKERSRRLIAVGNDIRARFLDAHLDRPLDVLVEDERVVDGRAICSGQTTDYVRVWFEGEGMLGRVASVVGERVRADGIEGRLCEGGGQHG
ncbi:MAG TPA: tRNA (N(6)-L-threonylcarbamoyladenosine(37)-C(2))-methylthiotransferase MtaB [Actinomycetota bacterium]|nr:tRNA (N(6)-L-threonylcarbamoyladenosine(37)-C(2))-methylthiotransferase MtaB [Actinomycetota bacterium]